MRYHRATLLIAVAAGCYWPVPQEEHAWPVIEGSLVRGGGEPAGGVTVVLTTKQGCRSPNALTRTDSLGRFAFSARQVKRYVMFLPPVERFHNGYELCMAVTGGATRRVYMGMVGIHADRVATPDTVSCVILDPMGSGAVGCAGGARRFARWEHGPLPAPRAAGWDGRYLVLLDRGVRWTIPSRAFIVWLDGDAGMNVAGVMEVPLIARVAEVEAGLEDPDGDLMCVWVESTARAREFEWRAKKERVAYRLGPPRVARRADTCARAAAP